MSVTDEVRKMVADAAGADSSKVNERTELWRDLRIGGDDMLELFLELQNRFRVDLSGVDLRSYSPNEDDVFTERVGEWGKKILGFRRITSYSSVTVADLFSAAESKTWFMPRR